MVVPHGRGAALLGATLIGALAAIGCGSGSGGSSELPHAECRASFTYTPADGENDVSVSGDFNAWAKPGLALAQGKDGVFRGSIPLNKGRYAYQLIVNGTEKLDPANPLTMYGADGREDSALEQPDCYAPTLTVVEAPSGANHGAATLTFIAGAEADPAESATLKATLDGNALAASIEGATLRIPASPSLTAGKHHLRVEVADGHSRTADIDLPFWVESSPFSWSDAILYQVIVDRFRRGSGTLDESVGVTKRMGGDYAGLTTAINDGYFDALHVDALWISPANRNVEGTWPGSDGREYEGYHGYWPVAAREAEPAFGGESGLDALIAAAHAKGIRVLLDIVPNHVHREHPYFLTHKEEWFNSPNGDCVCGSTCSWSTDIDRCWFTDYLPDFDWRKGVLVDEVLPDFIYWGRRFDFDGMRVDACPMMPRLVTRYLRSRVRTAFEQGGTPFYLIGETFTGGQGRSQIRWYLGPYGLSGQFDFPIMWALRSVVADEQGVMGTLLDEAEASRAAWAGSGAVMGLIVGNHDVARFLSVANKDDVSSPLNPPAVPVGSEPYKRLLIAQAFTFSQTGMPVIYYGDEIGLPGAGDPDNRRPMRFGADLSTPQAQLLRNVQQLARLRKAISAFRQGTTTEAERQTDLIAYWRRDTTSSALVILNRSTAAIALSLAVPGDLPFPASRLTDCFGGSIRVSGSRLTTTVAPLGVMVLTDEEICHESR